MIKSKVFTPEQAQYICRAYKKYALKDVTKRANAKFNTDFKDSQLANLFKVNGIKSGRTGYFKKGNIPWTTGTKGVVKAGPSAFKKGIKPSNTLPVGSSRINKDGHIEIKLDTGWITKQRMVWINHHGEIPTKHVIRFIDGNGKNCDIENLILVSSAENLQLSKLGYSKQPDELKESTLLIAKIIAKTANLGRVDG